MKKNFIRLFIIILMVNVFSSAHASVDSDFKERPTDRFTIYTGDGNYKQAYHWSFNENGQGPAVTIFLNHGSGGKWYDEIDTEFGPCGPDYLGPDGDFDGSIYAGLCEVDGQGNETYLADFNYEHVPVGPELAEFMIKKVVGSTQFAAWYWQETLAQFDSPVHIFMVGRYNVSTEPTHFDNALYWLNTTDQNSVTRETLPPYNFDGYGVSDIDGCFRPMHAAPDIAGFDDIIVEGRSNGGSAMIAMASDFHIWPGHMREFWARNLPGQDEPQPEPAPEFIAAITLNEVIANPVLAQAFDQMLSAMTDDDLMAIASIVITLPPVQDAYEQLLSQSLTLLAQGHRDESVHQLKVRRNELVPCLDRIAALVEKISDDGEPIVKLIVEYLYSRARLVDEMKMFPEFGLELLNTITLNESLGKVIYMLEHAMLGKQELYQAVMTQFSELEQ